MKHAMIDTAYGEVMLIDNNGIMDVYCGDNWDEYLGTIDYGIYELVDEEDNIVREVEKMF